MTNTVASRSPNDPVGLGLLDGVRTISFLFRIDEAIISMSYWRTSRSGPGDGEIWLGLLKPAAKAAGFFIVLLGGMKEPGSSRNLKHLDFTELKPVNSRFRSWIMLGRGGSQDRRKRAKAEHHAIPCGFGWIETKSRRRSKAVSVVITAPAKAIERGHR